MLIVNSHQSHETILSDLTRGIRVCLTCTRHKDTWTHMHPDQKQTGGYRWWLAVLFCKHVDVAPDNHSGRPSHSDALASLCLPSSRQKKRRCTCDTNNITHFAGKCLNILNHSSMNLQKPPGTHNTHLTQFYLHSRQTTGLYVTTY